MILINIENSSSSFLPKFLCKPDNCLPVPVRGIAFHDLLLNLTLRFARSGAWCHLGSRAETPPQSLDTRKPSKTSQASYIYIYIYNINGFANWHHSGWLLLHDEIIDLIRIGGGRKDSYGKQSDSLPYRADDLRVINHEFSQRKDRCRTISTTEHAISSMCTSKEGEYTLATAKNGPVVRGRGVGLCGSSGRVRLRRDHCLIWDFPSRISSLGRLSRSDTLLFT